MFRRIITCEHSSGRCRRLGIFTDASEILSRFRQRGRIHEIRDVMAWFNAHLKVPPRPVFHRGLGLCWFRTDSSEIRTRLWTWIALLRVEEVRVREVASMNPGVITYRDDHQVVAIPYAHAWWAR